LILPDKKRFHDEALYRVYVMNIASFFIPKSPKLECVLEGFAQEPFTEKITSVFETKNADGRVIEREE
jgi:hypothetical protein